MGRREVEDRQQLQYRSSVRTESHWTVRWQYWSYCDRVISGELYPFPFVFRFGGIKRWYLKVFSRYGFKNII